MLSEEEILAMMLKGEKREALEAMRARVRLLGDEASYRERISLATLEGNLKHAADLACEWMQASPWNIMPVLSLGETFLLDHNLEITLQALDRARNIKHSHPMYFRLLFLAATAAGAYSAAHGALFFAWNLGLPEMILRDLRPKALPRLPDGSYPEEENTDPRWLSLVAPKWEPDGLPVRLVWGEAGGSVWAYSQEMLEVAAAASVEGSRIRWSDFPEAAQRVAAPVGVPGNKDIDTAAIEPWMCSAQEGSYLPMALTQYGLWPTRPPQGAGQFTGVVGIHTPAGLVETGFATGRAGWGTEAWARLESPDTARWVASRLPATFGGRVTLDGPDPRIPQAFTWLTSGLPKLVLRPWQVSRPSRMPDASASAAPSVGQKALAAEDGVPSFVINRTPVLTLWAILVAERLGFPTDSALTLGKEVGTLAVYAEGEELGRLWRQERVGRGLRKGDIFLLGQKVPVTDGPHGPLAIHEARAIDPASVCRYLEKKFGADLPTVTEALRQLAEAHTTEWLEEYAFGLFKEFQPLVPPGDAGWGAKGQLDLAKIHRMAEEQTAWFATPEIFPDS